jgi:hypothetical protein
MAPAIARNAYDLRDSPGLSVLTPYQTPTSLMYDSRFPRQLVTKNFDELEAQISPNWSHCSSNALDVIWVIPPRADACWR